MTNFEWAKNMAASDDLIEKVLKANEIDYSISVMPVIMEEMMSDGDDETRKLLVDYLYASEDEKAAMDATLMHICGWSLNTLLEKMTEEKE